MDYSNMSIEIGVFHILNFLHKTPRFLTKVGKKFHHNANEVNVFSEKRRRFVDAYSFNISVGSLAEFQTIGRRLTNLPTYMIVKYEEREGHPETFVVYINPSAPRIKQQLTEYLNQVETILHRNETTRFALDIDFSDILKQYFSTGCCSCQPILDCRITITNFTSRNKLFSHPALWCLCLPVCLLIGPLHCAYRQAVCKDFACKVDAEVQPLVISQNNRAQNRNMEAQHQDFFPISLSLEEPPLYSEPPPTYHQAITSSEFLSS